MVTLSIHPNAIIPGKLQATHRNYPKIKLIAIKQKHFLWLTNRLSSRGAKNTTLGHWHEALIKEISSHPGSPTVPSEDRHSEHRNKQRIPTFLAEPHRGSGTVTGDAARNPPLLSWEAQPLEASLLKLGWWPTSRGALPIPLVVQEALLFLFATRTDGLPPPF